MNQIAYRRIVTGIGENGRSSIVSDGSIPQIDTLGMADFWRTSSVPCDVREADQSQSSPMLLPGAGGTIFRFFEIPAANKGATEEELRVEARKQFAAAGASECQVDTSRHPMMHATPTIDYVVLLKGRATLILDDGEVHLKPFDVVVQRGTNHYWVNSSSEPALFAAVLLDAK